MHEQPDHDTVNWIVRIGSPEKPFRAKWDEPSQVWTTEDLPQPVQIFAMVVAKWREESP
jgi:hypothetical protein